MTKVKYVRIVSALLLLVLCACAQSDRPQAPAAGAGQLSEEPTATATAPAQAPTAPEEPVAPSPTPATPVRQSATEWTMFRYSLDRAGYNPVEAKVRPPLSLRWKFDAKSKI